MKGFAKYGEEEEWRETYEGELASQLRDGYSGDVLGIELIRCKQRLRRGCRGGLQRRSVSKSVVHREEIRRRSVTMQWEVCVCVLLGWGMRNRRRRTAMILGGVPSFADFFYRRNQNNSKEERRRKGN